MAAYIIGEFEVTDPATYETYRPLAAAAVAKHGGRYLVRGGATVPLDGSRDLKRTIVVEFPSLAEARAFYQSKEYQAALMIRLGSSTGRLFIVEGVS